MNFHWGPLPKDELFQAEEHGWRLMWKPNLAVMVTSAVIIFGFLYFSYANAVKTEWPIWILLSVFIAILLVHELIHGAFFPDHGLSDKTTFGCWPKMGVCYAYYHGAFSYYQFIVTVLAPLVILSGLPFVAWLLLDQWWLSWIALFNFGISLGDIMIICFAIVQIPKKAVIKFNGFDIYWKAPTASESE